MLKPQVCKALEKQAAMLAQASRDLRGIALAAKTFNWPGLHKEAMDRSKAANKIEHETEKLVRDYGGDMIDIPPVRMASCAWTSYADAFEKICAIAMATQEGWKEIAAEAESVKDTDVDDWVDHYLGKGTDDIQWLNRKMKKIEQAGDNMAALMVIDENL